MVEYTGRWTYYALQYSYCHLQITIFFIELSKIVTRQEFGSKISLPDGNLPKKWGGMVQQQ